jgi:peptidoglycan/xylan/chitin deacetylase (PgdA/CDA1 family)
LVLSHDVDFISLKSYSIFSKTTLSFFKRSIWNNFIRTLKNDLSVWAYIKSLGWCLGYPLIKLGILTDPWEKSFWDIIRMEKRYGVFSTFFFLPFKNYPGHVQEGEPAPKDRECKYDVREYRPLLEELERTGWEVGVHGIDSHLDYSNAKKELQVFQEILPDKEKFGIRTHWLYPANSYSNYLKELKKAGYHYDSSYSNESGGRADNNEDIFGFPYGKYQPFYKNGVWALPLSIHDVGLMGNWRMNLSLKDSWKKIEELLDEAKEKNATVIALWHPSHFSAHRYWGLLYEKLLERAVSDGAEIKRCIDVVNEMEKKIHLESIEFQSPP